MNDLDREIQAISAVKSNSVLPYIVATTILVLIGVILIGVVLYLRPALDPLVVIGLVFTAVTTILTGVAAFIKSQETHASVNSQLTAWKKEYYELAHTKGEKAGTVEEQARVAEQKQTVPATASSDAVLGVIVHPDAEVQVEKSKETKTPKLF